MSGYENGATRQPLNLTFICDIESDFIERYPRLYDNPEFSVVWATTIY
jgi:hypothetical protein